MLEHGFSGFVSVAELTSGKWKTVPKEKGVYLVIRRSYKEPEFLTKSVGGHFKNRDPTVDVIILKEKWIKDTEIVYIGQAGGNGSKSTLQKRIRSYLKFGSGQPVGHWGGRYIWQLKDYRDLLIAWKVTEEDPSMIESTMIEKFRQNYGNRPFANLMK